MSETAGPPASVLSVDIRIDGIEIDGRLYLYPLLLAELAELFTEDVWIMEPSARARETWWWWEDSGVLATTTDGVHAIAVKFTVDGPEHRVRIEGRPLGEEYGPVGDYISIRDFARGFLMAQRSKPGPDQHVSQIIVEQKIRRSAAKKNKPAPRAENKPAKPGSVEFADLNFKLLVIQVLMYDKGLLTPAFDVHSFIADFMSRDIDLEEEGHAPIPEVLAFFEALSIPRTLLTEVDEIYQDGGNDIYLQIAPRWDGEDPAFDVANYSDVSLLPNLRSITLFDPNKEQREFLQARGIQVEQT